jgi:hypothetical protein
LDRHDVDVREVDAAIPLPLSVAAAAMLASHVPCPFGSVAGSVPNAE